MAALGLAFEMHQKISAFWSLASIGIAISAVLIGAFFALKRSVVITPSLVRRWRITKEMGGLGEPWVMVIPVRFEHGEVEEFTSYLLSYLRSMRDDPVRMTSSIEVERFAKSVRIGFVYRATQTITGNFYTRNILDLEPGDDGQYVLKLSSTGDRDWGHEVGSMMRMKVIEWSTLT